MSEQRKKSPKPGGSSSQPLSIPSRIGFLSSLSSLPDDKDTIADSKPTPKITKKSFREIARVFEECIQVKDRRYRLKTYKKCFIGTDAVTLLYELLQQIDELDETEYDASFSHHSDDHVITARVEFHQYTRQHACILGRALAEKFNLFSHVTNDHLLMDDYYMYRFAPKAKRLNQRGPVGRHDYTNHRESSASLGSIGSKSSEGDDDGDKDGGQEETKVLTKGKDNDDGYDDVEETKHYLGQLLAGAIAMYDDNDSVVYDEIAAMGMMTESIRFLGSSSLRPGSIRSKASSRFESSIASRKQKPSRFSSASSGIGGGGSTHSASSWISSASSSSFSSPLADFSPKRRRKKLKERTASITNVHEHLAKYDIDLLQVANEFELGVQVGTNRYHGKAYKQTFVGNDAVDFILRSRYATTRQDAIIIGNALMTEFNLFEHVSKQHSFKDNYYFYKFTEQTDRKSGFKERPSTSSISSASSIEEEPGAKPKPKKSAPKEFTSIQQIGDYLEKHAEIKDRRYHLKTYKQCFIGSQAVSMLMDAGCCTNRAQAVDIGRQLSKQLNLFEHVAGRNARDFEDDYYFYRFLDKDKRISPSRPSLISAPSKVDITGQTKISMANLREVAEEFQKGVIVDTHIYRFKKYKKTFIGSDAVDYMVNCDLAPNRKEAVRLGQRLLDELHLFHHVSREHGFRDDYKFYRFAVDDDSESAVDVSMHGDEDTPTMSNERMDQIAAAMRRDIKVKSRRWFHKLYKDTFLGTEAVSYLVDNGFAKTRDDAVKLGRDLAHSCNLLVHVEGDHALKDEKLFYYFVPEAFEKKDLVSLRSIADKFVEGVAVNNHRYRLRVYHDTFIGEQAVAFLLSSGIAKSKDEAVAIGRNLSKTFHLFEHVTRDHDFEDEYYFYRFMPESERLLWRTSGDPASGAAAGSALETADWSWIQKMIDFEEKVESKIASDLKSISRAVLWASKFRRLDPRWRILKFFNEVAQVGVENKIENGIEMDSLPYLVRFFNRASVFTVWRPTAFDAIRKMMLGQAVGKGLDIKGKSAKRGKNAGFVPFLQIGDNRHKRSIRTLPKCGTIRLFFAQGGFYARDEVVDRLEEVAKEMMDTVAQAKLVLSGDMDADSADIDEAKEALLWDMENPEIEFIEDYEPQSYGLELPIRLFWEAFVVRQDITRKPGSQYDSGRPSTPDFQDMNVYALLAKPASKESPKAVIIQNAKSDPMNPHELLMAYEERDLRRVLPVASDFDAFLVGTRRVHFDPVGSPLPSDQVNVLNWCVNHIGNVLQSPPRPETWTNRWLEVLKAENNRGFHPTIPRFGFGDPMSYVIMEKAVQALTADGAVRHGPECFNYYFPQELDEEFLVISDKLGQIPWKYMDPEELQEFLLTQVDDGFTFPLNPKWVLCDPGWKRIYDKLLKCENNEDVRNSMEIWFPKESGIRERIEEISEKYPYGFERGIREDSQ